MIFGLTPKIKKKIEKIIKWPEYTILDYKDRIFNKEKRKEYYKRHPPVFESQYDDEFKE
ncbi:hypothetical protein IJM86_07380 [bacterium]|nr:hypothetical protein [bacterium]